MAFLSILINPPSARDVTVPQCDAERLVRVVCLEMRS